MDNLRKLIKETLEKAVILEAAIGMSELIKDPHIGLSVDKGPNKIQLDLYDFSKGRMLGTIGATHIVENLFHVTGVAAEKGYGPLMYELAMMTIYDNGLMPTRSGDIRGNAWEIWKKFFQRDDVKKIKVSKDSRAYSDEFYPEDWGKLYVAGNTAFAKEPNLEYHALIERTLILMKNKSKSAEDIRRSGGDYFSYKYADS